MPKQFALPTLLLLAGMAVGHLCQEGTIIAWTPKPGTEYKFIQHAVAHAYGGKSDFKSLVIELVTKETVKSLNSDGTVTVEVLRTPGKVLINGKNVTESVAASVPSAMTLTRKMDGEEMEAPPESLEFGLQMETYGTVVYPGRPLIVGETWTFASQGDPQKGTAPGETLFTFKGQERVDGFLCNKVTIAAKEIGVNRPASANGTVWLSAQDGELVKKVIKSKGVSLKIPGAGWLNLEVTVDRTM